MDPDTVSSNLTSTITFPGGRTITSVNESIAKYTRVSFVHASVFLGSPYFTGSDVYSVLPILDVVQREPIDIPPPETGPPGQLVFFPSRVADSIPIPVSAAVVHSESASCLTPGPST